MTQKKGFIVLLVLGVGSYQPKYSDENGLMFFDTIEDANAEIEDNIKGVKEEIKNGNMDEDSEMQEDDFKIIPAILVEGKGLNENGIVLASFQGNFYLEPRDIECDDWEQIVF